MNDCILYTVGADGEHHELTFGELPTEDISYDEEERTENLSCIGEKVDIEISGRLCGDVEEVVKFITPKKKQKISKKFRYFSSHSTCNTTGKTGQRAAAQ